MSLIDTAGQDEKLDQNIVSTQNHTQFIERSNIDANKIGNCGGWAFDNHYRVGVAIETGQSVETYDSELAAAFGAIVGGGIGGSIGGGVGGAIGGALGILIGVAVDAAFLSHYDLSGRQFTHLAWDVHPGIEEVKIGGMPLYYASFPHSWSEYMQKYPGHLEAGKDISDYL